MFFKIKKKRKSQRYDSIVGEKNSYFQLLALLSTNKRTTRQIFTWNTTFCGVFFFHLTMLYSYLLFFLSQSTIRFFKFLVLLLESITNNVEQTRISNATTKNTLSINRFSNGILIIQRDAILQTPLPVPTTVNVDFTFLSVPSPLSLKWCWLDKIRNLRNANIA